ncbi:TetR/AcrR family transcriptional regulator [Salinithrix halophila]|uniref:TetR/AcrR family transcriptional regulator n=1 Tax=Salinithrix halophila TaxID=1485204 RepID=A0ABV8JHC0_9BACL
MHTADQIKKAARKLFSQHGYKEITVSRIAEEVGIKAPSIYSHYKNKEDLFLQVFEETILEHVHHVKETIKKTENMDVERQLFHMLYEASLYYTHDEDKIQFLKYTMIFPPQKLKAEIKRSFYEAEKMFSDMLRRLFAEGMKQKKIRELPMEHLLSSFYCLLDGLFTQLLYNNNRTTFEAKLQHLWSIYWTGIRSSSLDLCE